ncbi:MAG TPA: PAS domain S-box protein, partial [Coriobacteriia bacterium]
MRINQDITERKQAEQGLRESEARFRTLAESSPLAIFVNREDKVVLANPAAAKLFGASSPEDLIGRSAMDLFHPDSQARVRERIREAGETVPLVEVQIVRLDGTVVDVEVTASPLLDQGIAAIQVVLRDITERKRAETELRQSEKKYATVFHASPDSITITRLSDGEILEANEGFERLLGYTRAESVGKTTADLSVYADPGARDGLVTGLRETGELSDFDATLRRKDGTLAEVILSARVIEFQGEECFLAVVRDITERKQAEADRLHAEKFFRDTFEHADVGIAHVDSADGTWLRVNQCMCDLLGYTREELLATTFAAITHPDDVEQNVRHLRRMLAGDEETYAADKRYLRKDGSIIWVHLNVAPIRNEDGTPDYNITVMADITERKKAEETLRRSEQNLNLSVGRVGTWNWDLVTGTLEWSPRAKAMFGLPTDAEVTHESFLAAMHPEDREGADAAIKEALSGKTDCDME